MILSMMIFTIGCEPPKGEAVEYAKACDRENDNKTIETEGFLDDAGGVYCSNTSGRMDCGFKLKKDLKDEKGFSADIAISSGANSMDKLERGYQKADITIRNNESNKIDLLKKVKVTGTLKSWEDKTSPAGGGCYLKVYKIEQ